ncbi:uncharacterized protein N7496_004442 [Penicillium cataractarum]|uniref:DUF5672 domain-containing protein n=1 Tax=Penicillium cataractarum TaxID=2100454 RepID=A0A9W9VIH5_9EURO|nr:uncharacterized protein N7496_004442 [Penicillium cataractarum]KAJ5382014.1 hypothetical protein N7496_004442 [Penicillium cataractarum]
MRITFRVSIAVALVVTILLVKNHLDSLEPKWQADRGADLAPEFVLDSAGAHIELVSANPTRLSPTYSSHSLQASYSSSPIAPQSNPAPPSKSWPEPTNPPVKPTKFQPKSIPVDVPGAYDDIWQYPFWMDRDDEAGVIHNLNVKPKPKPKSTPKPKVSPYPDRVIVLGRMSWEDSDWLEEELPEWQHAVYVVDEPDFEYTVQMNKGKESNIYLQYIIDHYHKLPEYMVFLHAHRNADHVEFWEQDNALTVQRLQLDYLKKVGYVNLRCGWGPGCPDEVQPFRQLDGRTTEIAFAGAWIRIFNNTDVPEVVATPCCAQFGVTRAQVHARPLSDYQSFHRWLMETELDDETSGRVFEYLWHIIFGQDPVFCPSKQQCYEDVYGMEWDPAYEDDYMDWVSDDFWDMP